MKLLYLLILAIAVWFFSYSSFAFPLDGTTGKYHILKSYSKFVTHSPDIQDTAEEHHKYINKRVIIALVATLSLLVVVVLLLTCFWINRLKKLKNCNSIGNRNLGSAEGIRLGSRLDKYVSMKFGGKERPVPAIDYQLLMAATNNFDKRNVIGEGQVYKAYFNEHLIAAVKTIHACGHEAERKYQNKVEWWSGIQHQNILSLLGYCVYGEGRFLIYGIMENGSLERHLNGPLLRSKLTWQLRMRIALDIARGLEYLHERCKPSVIHGNLKSSNILLESNLRAKISDFGLEFSGGNLNETKAKITGTLAYVAPEYLQDGKLTDKSDVYAFGVILLELLLGRRPEDKVTETGYQSIATWALPQLTDRSKLPHIIDPAIRDTMDLKHLYQVAAIAVLCVQPEPSYRPLITDVLYSFIPLVPVNLGGSLRVVPDSSPSTEAASTR